MPAQRTALPQVSKFKADGQPWNVFKLPLFTITGNTVLKPLAPLDLTNGEPDLDNSSWVGWWVSN